MKPLSVHMPSEYVEDEEPSPAFPQTSLIRRDRDDEESHFGNNTRANPPEPPTKACLIGLTIFVCLLVLLAVLIAMWGFRPAAPAAGDAAMQAEGKRVDASANDGGATSGGSGSAGSTGGNGQAPPPDPPLHDYKAALNLCLDFFDAQKSGDLALTPHPPWRNSSHLQDGSAVGRDLAGGYYVDGGGVKQTGLTAFAMSMLAWSIVEFDPELESSGLKQRAVDLLKWGVDWLLMADLGRGCVVAQVGDSAAQDSCWQRPEDDSAARPVYTVVGANGPGAAVLADMSAAFAAASHVFGEFDPGYAASLRDHATMLFELATTATSTDDTALPGTLPYEPPPSSSPDFHDELLWAAAWLWRTTMSDPLHQYLLKPQHASLPYLLAFTHANKAAGAAVLLATFVLGPMEEEDEATTQASGADVIFRFQKLMEASICASTADVPSRTSAETLAQNMPKTQGGLLWLDENEPLHAAVQAAFLLNTYSRFLKQGAEDEGRCSGVSPHAVSTLSRSQIDYLLGSNPQQLSYMVGFDEKYPKFVRHRGASIPSLASDPTVYTCSSGQQWLQSSSPNPNILSGAVVGGPDHSDIFNDSRVNRLNEPAIYINAALVGLLASFSSP